MIIKMILLSFVFFLGNTTAFSQDMGVKCEVVGLDHNLSGKSGYLIEFGSFSVSKKEVITKFYKLPRTELILSVLAYAPKVPKYEKLSGTLVVTMILGKKRFPVASPDFDDEEMKKDIVSATSAGYPIGSFNKGGEGLLSMPFFGKEKQIQIMMKCKSSKLMN